MPRWGHLPEMLGAAAGLAAILLAVATAGCEDRYADLPPIPPPEEETVPGKPLELAALPPSEPPCDPPHGGYLLTIAGERGYVEWDADGGRLYYLDSQCRALSNVADPELYVSTPTGPRLVELTDCGDAQYVDACSAACGDRLRDPSTTGVIRFDLNGEACRVLLQPPKSTSQPSGSTSSAPDAGWAPGTGPALAHP